MLKAGGDVITETLTEIFKEIWEEEEIPVDWKTGLIVKLPKKGNLSLCKHLRGITLLSINKKWKDNITRVSSGSSRVAELILRITDRYQLKIVQVYAPTTSHSDEETDNFYNTIDKILEKQTHYTIVMGDINAKVGGQTNTSERATGCFGLGQRNERGDTLVEWATSKNFKIMNTQFQKKAGRRWTWRSPDGNTRNEIDYIMTDKPSMVTDVTVINRVNIGSDHRMVMGSITLNTRAERRKLLNKNTRTRVDTQMIGTKKNTFQLELKNRFTALEEDD